VIKRVLLATLNSRRPQRGMEHAFRGIFGDANVAVYDPMERRRQGATDAIVSDEFVGAAVAHRADWAWLQVHHSGSVPAEAIVGLRKALPGCVVSHFMGDLREEVSPYLASVCRACHLTLISSQGQLQMFLDAGAPRVQFCPIAVDWEEDVAGEPEWEPPFRVPDVVFCGRNYGETFPGTVEREEAARALVGAGVDFGVVGKGWGPDVPMVGHCERHQQSSVYRRAKVVLSINNFNEIRRYYSNRLFVALASGKPVVCRWVPGVEDDLQDGENCVLYRTPEELVGSVRRLLDDRHERDRIGAAGRALVLSSHTWFHRVLHVTARVERIRQGIAGEVPV